MIHTRRNLLAFGAASLGAPLYARLASAQSAEVTLKMHHFLPAVSNGHAKFLKPWADKVTAASNGRIKVDIFPSMQLGGTPPQLFDQARDGVADLVWTLPGNTPGRFPSVEAMELPFVAGKRAITNSKAMVDLTDAYFAKEFAEVKPVALWAHDHGLIHTNKVVKSMDDLKGMKLRFPTRLAGEALRALGATAIGMPVPQVPEALAQGVINGAVVPWEVVPALKLQEMVKFHNEIPGSPTLYTSTFILAMNKARYDSMPADLRKVIDDNSGLTASLMAADVWDSQAKVVSEQVAKRGNTISVIPEGEIKTWQAATKPVIENWLKSAKDRGMNGEKLLADVQAAVAKHMVA